MGKYIQGKDGKMAGSVGSGRDSVPAPQQHTDTPTPAPEDATDLSAVLREYAAAHRDRIPDAEELFEMRAAFGPDGVVVDALTGQVCDLGDEQPQFRDRPAKPVCGIDGCQYPIPANGSSFYPPHRISPTCSYPESARRPHCTCDRCF